MLKGDICLAATALVDDGSHSIAVFCLCGVAHLFVGFAQREPIYRIVGQLRWIIALGLLQQCYCFPVLTAKFQYLALVDAQRNRIHLAHDVDAVAVAAPQLLVVQAVGWSRGRLV